ncbi:MAG: lysophospholipid acyltransferase family protein [Burkholderiaceae bacterium]
MLLFLFRLFSRLPLWSLHCMGAFFGRIVGALAPAYRAMVRANLAQARIEAPGLQGRIAAETGKGIFELPFVWLRSPSDLLACTTTTGWSWVDAARERGRGIIFLTPHLGCFEVTAQFFALNTPDRAPMTVLYRPPRKTALRPIIELGRSRTNLRPAPADLSGVRQLLRALKRNEAIGLLPDQVPSQGEGVWAPYFGRAAYTMTLPAKLAQLTGATILLAYGDRLARGAGWVVRIFPFDEELTGSPEEQAHQINLAMERIIRMAPEQYFWGYNRYKKPKGVAPPPA